MGGVPGAEDVHVPILRAVPLTVLFEKGDKVVVKLLGIRYLRISGGRERNAGLSAEGHANSDTEENDRDCSSTEVSQKTGSKNGMKGRNGSDKLLVALKFARQAYHSKHSLVVDVLARSLWDIGSLRSRQAELSPQ